MNQWNQRECPSQERSWSLNCAALFGTRAVNVVMHAVSHAESGAGDDRDCSEQDKDTGLHGHRGRWCRLVMYGLAHLKFVSMRSEKPICAPPQLKGFPQRFLWKNFSFRQTQGPGGMSMVRLPWSLVWCV